MLRINDLYLHNNLKLDKLDAAHYASLNGSQGHCFKWMDEMAHMGWVGNL